MRVGERKRGREELRGTRLSTIADKTLAVVVRVDDNDDGTIERKIFVGSSPRNDVREYINSRESLFPVISSVGPVAHSPSRCRDRSMCIPAPAVARATCERALSPLVCRAYAI